MLHIQSFEFNPLRENTYVIYNEFNDCLIIDAGNYFQEENDEIVNFISAHKLNPLKLINTHCHLDHVLGNKFLSEKYGLQLHLHKDELPVLNFAPTTGLMYQVPFDNYIGEFIFLEERDKILLGKDELSILLTPGHSPASLSFYCENQNFVIAGDVLFEGSIGRYDLPGGDLDVLLSSIHKKLMVLPDETKVYPGHGNATTIGAERQSNPYLIR